MVGMIIVGPRADHQVRLPFADQADDFLAGLQCRQQFAVVNVEHFHGRAEKARGLFNLPLAPQRQRPAGLAPMADVAVGHGNKFDVMALARPQRADPAGLQFAIVRMRAETDDAQLAVIGRHPARRRFSRRERKNEYDPGTHSREGDEITSGHGGRMAGNGCLHKQQLEFEVR